ncbi:MAG: DUF6320 domain-containing protein [Candidatus Coprovivens sp.]
MKKCHSCKIEFNTSSKYCPLCQNVLVGEAKEIIFPKNIKLQTNSLIMRILLFCSLVMFTISCFIELMIIKHVHISLYVGLGLITNYIIIYYILRNSNNTYRMFARYGLLIIILLLIWYYVTGFKIFTNYIIPIVSISELIFNFIVVIIVRRNYLVKYTSTILMNLFLLIIPMIFVELKMTTNNVLSYVCCLFAIISIIGLLVFFFDDIKEELSKLFNI